MLLPPPVVHEYARTPITFAIPIRKRGAAGTDCQLGGDVYRMRVEPKQVVLELGSPAKWQDLLAQWDQLSNRVVESKVSEILAAPELLEQRGCLAAESALRVRQLLRETLPMRPQQGLFAVYGHRVGSGAFDLRPGLRLKVVRARFSKPAEQRKSSIDGYIGLTTVSYDVAEDAAGWVTLQRSGVAFEPESMRATVRDAVPQDMLRLPSRPVYRFLMQTSYLRSGVKRFAILLGTQRVSEMRALEAKLAADPAVPCATLTSSAAKAVCVSFEGDVTVSPEVQVTVNGVSRYVPWGATIANLLREVKAASHVRMRRVWEGQLRRVDAEDQAALARTVLTGGDEIAWDSVP
ncbi:hypothetical protein F183_A06760 [Bryobacterales bacterium F-183]|nr:hypothetical protein F183_A06760 [Bryobacterales bacterium F-183]